MKITKTQLNSIIQEELAGVLGEAAVQPGGASTKPGDKNKAPADKGELTSITVGDEKADFDIYQAAADAQGKFYEKWKQGPTGHAHQPGIAPVHMRKGTGAFYEKDWSDQIAASLPVKPIEGPITQGPKKSFNNVHSTPGVSEALKQMVREELKNLLES